MILSADGISRQLMLTFKTFGYDTVSRVFSSSADVDVCSICLCLLGGRGPFLTKSRGVRGVWGEVVPLLTPQQHPLGCVGRGSTFVNPTPASLGVCGER